MYIGAVIISTRASGNTLEARESLTLAFNVSPLSSMTTQQRKVYEATGKKISTFEESVEGLNIELELLDDGEIID